MLQITAPLLAQIRKHAEASYPHECCGILIGTLEGGIRSVAALRPAANLNTERAQDRYLMDPKDQLAAEKEARLQGHQVIGYYHSHPDHPAMASSTDSELAWENVCYFIVSVQKGLAFEEACFIRHSMQSGLVPEAWKVQP
jgi:proteasome lid subunit RPN8/RPN11